MSAANRQKIKETIAQIGQAGAYEVHLAKVVSVSESEATMIVDVLGLKLYDVRLRAVITDATGMWVLPKVESYVIIGQIEGGVDHVLLQASEIDKVFIKIAGKTLVVDTAGFVFNDGENGGMVKVDPLFEKIKNLEQKVNGLITTLKAVSIPAGGAAFLFSVPFGPTTPLTLTLKTELENEDVSH